MPFIFTCKKCKSMLYQDANPLLQDPSFNSPTYLQKIINKIGRKCPYCGRKLKIPPAKIEVFRMNEYLDPKRANHASSVICQQTKKTSTKKSPES